MTSHFLHIDWHDLLVPQTSLAEIFLRGTFVYFLLLLLFRIFKRQAGAVGLSDLLVIVLIADASQNAMSADYKSLPDGAVLIGTLIFWDQFLDWLGFRFPLVERLLQPPAVLLVKDGKINARNMRRELISPNELMSHLRQQGIMDLKDVRRAFIEGDGQISIVRADAQSPGQPNKRRGQGMG